MGIKKVGPLGGPKFKHQAWGRRAGAAARHAAAQTGARPKDAFRGSVALMTEIDQVCA
jgi:hypothetical protein